MKKTFIILGIFIIAIVGGIVIYLFMGKGNTLNNDSNNINTSGNLPAIISSTTTSQLNNVGTNPIVPTSSLQDYLGTASEIFGKTPTGTILQIGTRQGIVAVNNFYISNPPVNTDEDLIIKLTQNYFIDYDPADSSFWIGIQGMPFNTWKSIAEQDFLSTLEITSDNACKLNVTVGTVYSPGNPNNGKSMPLDICGMQ